MSKHIEEVFILGAGKLGSSLSRLLRRAGVKTTLRAGRRGWPQRRIDADVVVLAVRDPEIMPMAEALARAALVGHRRRTVAVLHCAGALGPEVLGVVRRPRVAVGQMHPMVSFADRDFTPSVARAGLQVAGDRAAVRLARQLGRLLGMTPRSWPSLDYALYHASGALVANGAAALTAAGMLLLDAAGVRSETAAAMLGPLLRSVADNVERLGLPHALTGPVRRGDVAGIQSHLRTMRAAAPELLALYRETARAQLPLARSLGEAAPSRLKAISAALGDAGQPSRQPGVGRRKSRKKTTKTHD